MLSSLYKYMPYRRSFFDNFLVNASFNNSLNDPFEYNLSSYDHFASEDEAFIGMIHQYNAWNTGIISFTTVSNNLLMWSHYADSHKGIVVEYDYDHPFFHGLHEDELSKTKRNYDSFKYKSGWIESVIYQSVRLNESIKVDNTPFFIKSTEWSYEEEKRIVLPVKCADKVFDLSTKELKEIDKNSYFVRPSNSLIMFKIEPSAIKSIILGVNMSVENKNEITSLFNSNPFLNRIKIKYASLNNYNFSLDILDEDIPKPT